MSDKLNTSCAGSNGPRVLLYERRALIRQGLRCLLEHLGFRVVAEAADVCDLTRACCTRPDVIVADQSCSGTGLTSLLKLCPDTKIVFLVSGEVSQVERHEYAVVSKSADATALSTAILRACGGARWEPLGTPSSPTLKARDWEVLKLLATGRTNKEIGSALGVTEKTVRHRLTEIFASIEVRNRTEAALYALGHRKPDADTPLERPAA